MDNQLNNSKDQFRDKLATVTDEGKRVWIFPKKPKGKFYNLRSILSIFLLAFLFGAPFIKINGHPFMLLNVLERKFILFGVAFGPHDFHLFGLAMITIFISLFLFTVVYGRIFCGWACPQTIFLEMVFRKIEYWIEGDAKEQRALRKAEWNGEKYLKKISKHIIFVAISFLIGNTFLAWIIGVDNLKVMVTDGPFAHFPTFGAIVVFTGLFYYVFSTFREQACTMVCPYGRLQGVMLDQNSIVIHYDHVRGEPRGKHARNRDENLGDCIDCHQCVDVCPTGIDIRNGTQLECVNCTACIDACDGVMEKINKPKQLIKYASKNDIETGKHSLFTFRAVGYTVILLILISILTYLMATRTDFEVTVLRTKGIMSKEMPDNKISNLYDFKIVNKTFDEIPAEIKLLNADGEIKVVGSDLVVEPQGVEEGKLIIILPADAVKTLRIPIEISFTANGEEIEKITTSFLGKIKRRRDVNK